MDTAANAPPPEASSFELQPIVSFLNEATIVTAMLLVAFCTAFSDAEKRHIRRERLQALRLRHRWKRSDKAYLETLELRHVACRKLNQLEGRGRPVVKPHQEFGALILSRFHPVAVMFDKNATPSERRLSIKLTPYWPHLVESLYRGEYALAKQAARQAPCEFAEEQVGRDLAISPSTVRKLCGQIRQIRESDPDQANFPPETLAKFNAWLRDGGLPDLWE
jgi:hypothetical protein